jgi:plasmid stabilization system protein ParE
VAFRVELTKSAEADLGALYLWVKGRAPHQGAAWFSGLEQAILSLGQRPARCPIASESSDPKRPVRVLHDGRARHVYRVRFWIDSANRVAYVLHVRRGAREALRLPIVSSESE